MRDVFLIVLASFTVGCLSATRIQEVHCLGSLMVEVGVSQQTLDSLESERRVAREGRSLTIQHMATAAQATAVPINPSAADDLDGQLIQQWNRHGRAVAWYQRVSHRVQTRFEEDELLYSTLSMLVTSPISLVLYPVFRWNVRSVLWDEGDPDSPDDPVNRFCTGWLTRIDPSAAPEHPASEQKTDIDP